MFASRLRYRSFLAERKARASRSAQWSGEPMHALLLDHDKEFEFLVFIWRTGRGGGQLLKISVKRKLRRSNAA